MSVLGLRHVRQAVVQEMRQLTKEVGLAADVRGQHHGLDDDLAIVEVVGVERRGQSRFVHQRHAGSPVMVFQHGVVVVQPGQVGGGDDEKLIKNSVDKICGAIQYINMFPAEFKPWFLAEASKGATGKEILVNFHTCT